MLNIRSSLAEELLEELAMSKSKRKAARSAIWNKADVVKHLVWVKLPGPGIGPLVTVPPLPRRAGRESCRGRALHGTKCCNNEWLPGALTLPLENSDTGTASKKISAKHDTKPAVKERGQGPGSWMRSPAVPQPPGSMHWRLPTAWWHHVMTCFHLS